jgi:hypothetical protein
MKKTLEETPIIETIHAKHEFTQEELLELSRSLGRTCSEISTLESEKSAVAKDFAFRIETKEITRDSLVGKVTSGYEMRPTECNVVLDPANRSKDYFRLGTAGTTGFVERREMTAADFQLSFPKTEAEPETK